MGSQRGSKVDVIWVIKNLKNFCVPFFSVLLVGSLISCGAVENRYLPDTNSGSNLNSGSTQNPGDNNSGNAKTDTEGNSVTSDADALALENIKEQNLKLEEQRKAFEDQERRLAEQESQLAEAQRRLSELEEKHKSRVRKIHELKKEVFLQKYNLVKAVLPCSQNDSSQRSKLLLRVSRTQVYAEKIVSNSSGNEVKGRLKSGNYEFPSEQCAFQVESKTKKLSSLELEALQIPLDAPEEKKTIKYKRVCINEVCASVFN